MANILITDDEKGIVEIIKKVLEKDNHKVDCFDSYQKINKAGLNNYDLLILDVMMPGKDGFTFCSEIRNSINCPIIFLTAKTNENDIVYGLALGGDDYITKPFRISELRARINAHLRRDKRENHSVMKTGNVIFDLSAKTLSLNNSEIYFTKSEYMICEFLAKNRGHVFSREQIYENIFGFDALGDSSTVAVHIKNIRAKFSEQNYNPIETVWGIGYKWL